MRQQWTDYKLFLQEFRRTFESTGAVAPSGPFLARALATYVEKSVASAVCSKAACSETNHSETIGPNEQLATPRRILEVGPGTGAVTAGILEVLRPTDTLTLVELNEKFVERLEVRFKEDSNFKPYASQVTLLHASITDLDESKDHRFDVIVSGLPFNNFPAELVETILTKLHRLVKAGGTISFFEYIQMRQLKTLLSRGEEKKRLVEISSILNKRFEESEFCRQSVLRNIPPAWVHHLQPVASSDNQSDQ